MKDSKNILKIVDNVVVGIKDNDDRIKSITIPEGIEIIGNSAFLGCGKLKNIVLPASLRRIEKNAFFGCCGFESVTIPDNVTFLGQNSFRCCSNLKEVLFNGTLDYIGKYAFGDNYKSPAFRFPVPYGEKKVTAYKGFNISDVRLFCRDFQYREGATYTTNKAKMCECGFHAYLNPLDCFNYYYGALNLSYDFLHAAEFHEVVIDDIAEFDKYGTKVCGKKITIGRKLTINDMFEAFNKI